ncbi:phage tail protein I [Burkholderia sp. Bp8986]|uniref:phage tail protein I n=1 Tax=Burkholderia sp. Bp8986 TaxID=2184550 RepID=UPI000F5A34AC|nr:phage tail protein I [Burkholderia sp. Bp8986]RQS60416.1 phage tail protein I [Burkholderia sp. Bp8986]
MADVAQLLPPNATTLEKRLAQAASRLVDLTIPVKAVWNPRECPAELLPWMAWGFGVDQWDSTWTESEKRNAIATALYVQQHKGTIGAVRTAIGALGYDVTVQEWFNQIPAGAPYTFDVLLDSNQVGIDQAALDRILKLIETFKNLRSHLIRVRPSVTTRGGPVVAGYLATGNEITITYDETQLHDRTLDGSWSLDGAYSLSGLKI